MGLEGWFRGLERGREDRLLIEAVVNTWGACSSRRSGGERGRRRRVKGDLPLKEKSWLPGIQR